MIIPTRFECLLNWILMLKLRRNFQEQMPFVLIYFDLLIIHNGIKCPRVETKITSNAPPPPPMGPFINGYDYIISLIIKEG